MDSRVVVVGGGPAGIGCTLALRQAGVDDVPILDAETIGATFRRWPEKMRLITPSFHGNPFFQTDLNAITPDTSPAVFFQTEHVSGQQYADYLQAIVIHFDPAVHVNERVLQVRPESNAFSLDTERSSYRAKAVLWAGGESFHRKQGAFRGAANCVHSSVFRSASPGAVSRLFHS